MYAGMTIRGIMDWSLNNLLPNVHYHKGRTDRKGGHRDWLNKTGNGFGSYHYHHGQPSHLHPGDVCPSGELKAYVINPYTGKMIDLGMPHFYDDKPYFSVNLISKALTANDELGVELADKNTGGSFYVCTTGNSSKDKGIGEQIEFTYPKGYLGLQNDKVFNTNNDELQLLYYNEKSKADDIECYAYVSLEAIGSFMTQDSYFIDFCDDGLGVWTFKVRKPKVQIITPKNGDLCNVGEEITVTAKIENVSYARLVIGTYIVGYLNGFLDKQYDLINEPYVNFTTFKLTEDQIGILPINVDIHTGGTAMQADLDARDIYSNLRIRVEKTGGAPLNDYKTIENPNLVGINALKEHISLAQLNSFSFEYNRQTYTNKLKNYTANSFQGIVSNVADYLNEVTNHLDYLKNDFGNISDKEVISNFNYHIEKYGIGKCAESVLMFMAIKAQESAYGKKLSEGWDSSLGYAYNQRGAGYSQLTGITKTNPTGNQIPFLQSIGYSNGDINAITDLPFHIATYLPMSSACYSWVKGNAINSDITTNIVEYGIKKGADMRLIYLAAAYAINGGYTILGLQNLLDGRIYIEPSSPPNGWSERKSTFNNAINYFSHGASIFKPF